MHGQAATNSHRTAAGQRRILASLLFLSALAPAVPARAGTEAALGAATPAPYAVVLADGRQLLARSRPLIAMGIVSFLASDGSAVSLSATQVDLTATRARLAQASPQHSVLFDDKAIERTTGRVQVVDPSLAAPPPQNAEAEDRRADEGEKPEAIPVGDQVGLLRARIEQIDRDLLKIPATDRQATLLASQQRDLQAELSRLLGQ